MSEAAHKLPPRFTWKDYQTWPDDERWEIIGGEPFAMSPSATFRHQRIAMDLGATLHACFKSGPCQLLAAPMDVRLSEEDVVQPDLLVVCDPSQVKRTYIEGAPRLVVEILSEHSAVHDRMRKSRLYARAGVAEYWIVTPFPSVVEVLSLDGESFRMAGAYGKSDTVRSPAFPELAIAAAEIFTFPLEPGEEPPAFRERPSHYTVVN